jgi:5'-nucleotidase
MPKKSMPSATTGLSATAAPTGSTGLSATTGSPAAPAIPLILLTNDDGFFAEGIQALFRALKGLGRLFIVAPDREKSASSLALSLHQPLRVQRIRPGVFAVDGTPADGIYLALKKLLPRKPDLIVSGMNPGPNLGQQDIAYSGTVAAAVQGTFFGVPSAAFSLIADADGDFHYRESAAFVRKIVKRLLRRGLPAGVTLNVNIPPPPVKGLRVTSVGLKIYEPDIIEQKDPRGNSYYWLGRGNPKVEGGPASDVKTVLRGYISVTPIHNDPTDRASAGIPLLKELVAALSPRA